MDQYVAEIRMFAGNYAPSGWAFCQGQIMAISQNTALFSLLGTMYGGDGKVTFALPNLMGAAPVGAGMGPGLTERYVGEQGGSSTVTLLTNEMPMHNHKPSIGSSHGSTADLTNAVWTVPPGRRPALAYGPAASTGAMNNVTVGVAGGSQPHNNCQPYLAVSFIIALEGIFPPRS